MIFPENIENDVIKEDVEHIASMFAGRKELDNQTILVTGATGLIGSQIIKALAYLNESGDKKMQIVAYVRNEEKARKVFGDLLGKGDITVSIGDINEPIICDKPVNYIIHGASATSSGYFVSHPVETIKTAINGTVNVLEYARNQTDLKGVVYLSSLEVYGTPPESQDTISESDYGYIDILNVRSSYSEGKKMVECLCASYAAEYQVPVKIARLSQTFGPGVGYSDGRVFAEFARCAVEQRDIILHTQGNTVRSYCYVKDAISAILYILLDGQVGDAYNVTNMDTAISIRDMARLVASTVGKGNISVRIEVPDNLESFGYNPEMVIRLDSHKLEKLGWRATVGLEEMYRRMICSFNIQ